MASNEQFVVKCAPNLTDALREGLPFGEQATLLYYESPAGSIRDLEIIAMANETDTGFGQLNISSALRLARPYVDIEKLSEHFTSTAQAHNPNFTLHTPSNQSRKRGIVMFGDNRVEDAVSTILPLMGGKLWVVNTLLEHFRYDDVHDREGITRALGHHAFALTSLVAVISDIHGPNKSKRNPNTMYLTMPKDINTKLEGTQPKPAVSNFEAFVGIDTTIDKLKGVVRLANIPREVLDENGIEPIQAVLLHGPSGVGKTSLMDALGRELDADVMPVKFTDVSGNLVGEWANNVDAIFESAYMASGRVLIILDELEGLINNGNPSSTANVTAVLKRQLEELKAHPNVFVVAATNKINAIDPDILVDKRIPLKLPIGLPSEAERADIFRTLLGGVRESVVEALETVDILSAVKASPQLSDKDLNFNVLASQAVDFSGGDIKEVIANAKRRRFLESPDMDIAIPLTQAEILQAIQDARKTRR